MIALLLALATAGDPERGAVVAGVAGCASCHTVEGGAPYAGGYVLDTPFGTFVGSNLTPDREHGIGAWTLDDFERALRKGRSPEGRPYYPAFPYPAFHGITDADLEDLWAFLQTVPASARPEEPHRLRGLNGWRFLLRFWKLTGFRRLPDELDRGAYLGLVLGHCGGCHTPRGGLGVPKEHRALSGTDDPPEPGPNITPSADGIGEWTAGELASFLEDGMAPDGDVSGGEMRRLVLTGTSLLSEEDRRALAEWVLAHPPLDDRGKPSTVPDKPERDPDPMDW